MVDTSVKVLIGVPTPSFSRQDAFYDYWNIIEKPIGTVQTFARGQSPARNRNLIIEQGIGINATHILFLDDDVAPPKDILTKLVAHDKDIVTGLYLMRTFPHKPIIFEHTDAHGRCGTQYLDKVNNDTDLIPIVAAGLGAVLIKTSVFRKMAELDLDKDDHGYKGRWIRLGELESDHWCDDIGFYRRARQAGFSMFCDLSIKVGHFGQVCIRPEFQDGKWMTTLDTFGSQRLSLPQFDGSMK